MTNRFDNGGVGMRTYSFDMQRGATVRIACVATISILVGACGLDHAPPDSGPPMLSEAFASGTRLKAMYDAAGDTAELVGWFDATLGIECEVRRDARFGYRCLPAPVYQRFADAGCTIAVADFANGQVPAYVSVALDHGCVGEQSREGYAVGPAISTTLYVVDPIAGCVVDTSPPPAAGTIHLLNVPPQTLFAAATISGFDASGGLVRIEAEFGDGASQWLGTVDAASGAECFHDPMSGRCLAGDPAYDFGDYARGATCGTPIAYSVGGAECEPARYVRVFEATQSGYRQSLRSVAGQVVDADAKQKVDCAPAEPRQRYWDLGAVVDPVTLPAMLPAMLPSTGRLHAAAWASAIGTAVAVRSGEWYDGDTLCTPYKTIAGVRCLPAGIGFGASQFYADANCTVPLIGIFASEKPPLVAITSGVGGLVTMVRALDPEHGGQVSQLTGGLCEAVERDPTQRYFPIGPVRDLQSFVEIVKRRAP